ncbi:MAG: aminotransferase class IV [Actinomycetota bacterium]|nr:aminotransferase class IV [Actinomycetota bacterium]
MKVTGHVLMDGQKVEPEKASISIFDIALLRGFGCFESLRSYNGVAFRQRQHLDRLGRSAAALGLGLPDRADMERWVADRAAVCDCTVRVVVTGGTDERGSGENSRFIVFAEPLPQVDATVTLLPVEAPWHPDGFESELTGAKTLSYGPNVAARLHAKQEGFGDALLVGRSGTVLEGPTNTVAWVTDGVFETPGLELGILASVTREAVLEVANRIGAPVNEGRFPLERMVAAEEVMALSTLREVQPVVRIGDTNKEVGPVTRRLIVGLGELIQEETTG